MTPAPVRIVPPEEIDAASVEQLSADLSSIDPGSAVLVDCSGVTFMDSSGIRALVEESQRQSAGGGSLKVENPSRVVRRLLELTDLTEFIAEDN